MSEQQSRFLLRLAVAAAIGVSVLAGCGATGGVADPARSGNCFEWPQNETSGLTPEYYAAVSVEEPADGIWYFVEYEDEALPELRRCGLTGERSRYSASDVEEMRRMLMETPTEEWGDDPLFTFSVSPEDDIFEVRGRLDEDRLAEILDGYTYRYIFDDFEIVR